MLRAGYSNKKMKRYIKSWLWKKNGLLILPYPVTNFEIQKYCQNELSFNGVYSRDNLPKRIKDEVYVNKSWWICGC